MITTSNYETSGKNPLAVAISIQPPPNFRGLRLPELAPTWEMVTGIRSGKMCEQEYTARYFDKMLDNNVSVDKILTKIHPDAILLCYEPPFIFCHRRLVAMWIENETGIHVPELLDKSLTTQYNFTNNTLVF